MHLLSSSVGSIDGKMLRMKTKEQPFGSLFDEGFKLPLCVRSLALQQWGGESLTRCCTVALQEGYSNAKSDEDREAFSLSEIQANAEELLDVRLPCISLAGLAKP
jgi:hypothetical protein